MFPMFITHLKNNVSFFNSVKCLKKADSVEHFSHGNECTVFLLSVWIFIICVCMHTHGQCSFLGLLMSCALVL